jgi:hypothetical protein
MVKTARIVCLAGMLLLCGLPASASAKSTFFGINFDGHMKTRSGAEMQWKNWQRMREVGVQTARTSFEWGFAQVVEGQEFDHWRSDIFVRLATRRKIKLLPVVTVAPSWARAEPDHSFSRPRDPKEYAAYLTALVERYGPKGTFWPENPDLEKRPIREWQIWNEPGLEIHWRVKEDEDWAKQYGKLLRASFRALRKADPKAKVVLGGIVNDSWNLLRKLYKRGDVQGFFDVAAVHPYTVEPAGVVELVKRFRSAMRKGGDGRKPLWVTEFGLPASKGKVDDTSPLQTTSKGMAKFLRGTYGRLLDTRGRDETDVSRAYWYTWSSSYGSERIWNFTGLIRHRWRSSGETVKDTPSLDAFRDVAKR